MPLLKYRIENQILQIKLADPQSQNAFSPAMAEEFASALDRTGYRGVVLSAEGQAFCSGGNLHFYKGLKSKEEGLAHNQRITEILNGFAQLNCPKACFVDGLCVGGGVELLSCFDYILASPQSLFGLWQRRMGLTFGWGGQPRLATRMNPRNLEAWLISAQTLSTYKAHQWGVVDGVILSARGLESCTHWVEDSCKYGDENLSLILENRQDQASVFPQLWLAERHKKVLKKFK